MILNATSARRRQDFYCVSLLFCYNNAMENNVKCGKRGKYAVLRKQYHKSYHLPTTSARCAIPPAAAIEDWPAGFSPTAPEAAHFRPGRERRASRGTVGGL